MKPQPCYFCHNSQWIQYKNDDWDQKQTIFPCITAIPGVYSEGDLSFSPVSPKWPKTKINMRGFITAIKLMLGVTKRSQIVTVNKSSVCFCFSRFYVRNFIWWISTADEENFFFYVERSRSISQIEEITRLISDETSLG